MDYEKFFNEAKRLNPENDEPIIQKQVIVFKIHESKLKNIEVLQKQLSLVIIRYGIVGGTVEIGQCDDDFIKRKMTMRIQF